ncbi:hypothetical protein D9615_005918 [Tricholomella constricta]|uniref:Uncharacterized protein n=1 Tax=Tricholomella constricta TaxID=117010 RepID=A0A8H5H8U5_9AGAR|nr:hypothetical protein D9615_005918 [Tricholomella constricta]
MLPYSLPLNKVALVFFPPFDDGMDTTGRPSSNAQVVQVIVKQNGKLTLDDLAMFFPVQQDITMAVERILVAHITSPLPANLTIEGEGYRLHGAHKPWKYGKKLRLTLGRRDICAAEDKWVFIFDPVPVPVC